MDNTLLSRTLRLLLFFILATVILYYGRPFLVPLALGGLLALLLLPLARRFEKRGLGRVLATALSLLALLLVLAGVAALLAWQMQRFSEDLGQLQEKTAELKARAEQFASETLGISPEKQAEMMQNQQSASVGESAKRVALVLAVVSGILVDALLVLVYVFLFLCFREHFKQFILRIVPKGEQAEAKKVMREAGRVAQKYVSGMGAMIGLLWVLYGIGFSIVGVKNAFFFAILCGLLEIVPFVGNLTGTGLTVLASLAQGDTHLIVGILITYGLVQFIQSYVLEPLVVGAEVNINPTFTILGLVAAETVWGIGGMVLAVPLLGMLKIVCDHVEPLKPYGFLIGAEQKKKQPKVWVEKVKGWFK